MKNIPTGTAMMAVGVLHQLVGLMLGWEHITGIVADGGFGTIQDHQPFRMAIFWFLAFGFLFIGWGQSVRVFEREGHVMPHSFALQLASLGAFGVFFMPMSGFWTVFVVAAIAWQRANGRA